MLLWIVLCAISGGSVLGCVFLIVGMLWLAPHAWNIFISKTFEDKIPRALLMVFVILIILGIFSLI